MSTIPEGRVVGTLPIPPGWNADDWMGHNWDPNSGEYVVNPVITSPVHGSVVNDPLYPISGSGAVKSGEVNLYSEDHPGEPNATVTADENGNFSFAGDTPIAPGTHAWVVESGGIHSPAISVTLEATAETDEVIPEPPRPWDSFTKHAELDGFVAEEIIEVPDGWSTMTIAEKKTWLNDNV